MQHKNATFAERKATISDTNWSSGAFLPCLAPADARILHMPGELFVEYRLAVQKMRPDLLVAIAACGEYAPGYIGPKVAYHQGGYETSPGASKVAPQVEQVLLGAVRKLREAAP